MRKKLPSASMKQATAKTIQPTQPGAGSHFFARPPEKKISMADYLAHQYSHLSAQHRPTAPADATPGSEASLTPRP